MIYFHDISLSFLDKVLFDNINWTIHPKSRIGLVGDNGAGKTTLFRCILGHVLPDAGYINISSRKQKKIGYLPQDLVELDDIKVIDYLKKISGITELENSIHEMEKQIAQFDSQNEKLMHLTNKYTDVSSLYNAMGGYSFEAKAKQILTGFGFKQEDTERNCSDFSGGWKMRILLSSILLMNPDLMLLDEPTNHLDTESMEWLESYLKNYNGTLITISHDRFFLDKIVNQIADLSNSHIHIYKGNYSRYLYEKEKHIESLKKEYELQKAQIKKTEKFIEKFRYKATKAAQVQSRIKMLEKFKEVKLESKAKKVVMKFPEYRKSSKEVVKAANLSHYYGNLNVFSNLNFSIFRGDKVAFVGLNGSGKSTLSRLLSLTEIPASGAIQYGNNVNVAFFSQESSENIDYNKTVWEIINNTETKANDQEKRNLLGAFLFSGDDIFKPVSILSGGEKSRLALLKIMLLDSNFLILDEPTNHLDFNTKNIFHDALIKYQGTVAIVSHDRYFLDSFVNKIFELKDKTITFYNGNYTYFIEKRLLNNVNEENNTRINNKIFSKQSVKTKNEKRLEAEERNRIYRIKSVWKKELNDIEKNILYLENKKYEYESFLCDQQILKNSTKIKDTHIALKNINTKLEEYYSKWSEIENKLENITPEN